MISHRFLLFSVITFILLGSGFYYYRPAAVQSHHCPMDRPEWGFFGHKRINRMAVFTLPPEMMFFFKKNIDYLTDHAADPDMRRYAVNWEAPRHYIDLDEYDESKGPLPLLWIDALMEHATVHGVRGEKDTLLLYAPDKAMPDSLYRAWEGYFYKEVMRRFSSDDKTLDADTLMAYSRHRGLHIPDVQAAFFTENLSAHGILPWNLQQMQRRLTEAFRQKDTPLILKLCADIGHYIGDAHVPLHTTSNYNGQKSNQIGIHGFWESRLPELYADEQYDYFVGKAGYIDRKPEYFWKIVRESHQLVDSVLSIEWMLRSRFPADRQMCADVRNGVQVLTQCRDFAAAYHQRMQGMVERRMREAVHSVASVWYTAWLDAGAPDLREEGDSSGAPNALQEDAELQQRFNTGKILGRPEEH